LICGGLTVCTTDVVGVGDAFAFFLFWAKAPKEINTISRRIDSCFISLGNGFLLMKIIFLKDRKYLDMLGYILLFYPVFNRQKSDLMG
jgi:hypothetical protein